MPAEHIFHRLELLTGKGGLDRLGDTSVAVFGLGGVGSWAAEGLLRSGVGQITLIDNDVVDISNINRQLQAHTQNLGAPKVTELQQRLAMINPDCRIESHHDFYGPENAADFQLSSFDYVLDCIDSVPSKVDLVMRATSEGATVFSSLGAAFRLDPAQVKVASIWETQGCSLARVIRRRLRQHEFSGDFQAVFSPETLEIADRTVNGSAVQVTATFGMFLTGLVVQSVLARD